eukprot:358921-Chlamydomonas_euryale.AAC.4
MRTCQARHMCTCTCASVRARVVAPDVPHSAMLCIRAQDGWRAGRFARRPAVSCCTGSRCLAGPRVRGRDPETLATSSGYYAMSRRVLFEGNYASLECCASSSCPHRLGLWRGSFSDAYLSAGILGSHTLPTPPILIEDACGSSDAVRLLSLSMRGV